MAQLNRTWLPCDMARSGVASGTRQYTRCRGWSTGSKEWRRPPQRAPDTVSPSPPTYSRPLRRCGRKIPPPGMRGCYGQPLAYVSLGSSGREKSYAQRKTHLTLNPTLPSQTLRWTAGQSKTHPRCRLASRRPRPIPSSKGLHCISAWQKAHSARWRQCSHTWSPGVATQVYLGGRSISNP